MGHSTMESRTKSTDTNLTNAPDGTTSHTHSSAMSPELPANWGEAACHFQGGSEALNQCVSGESR